MSGFEIPRKKSFKKNTAEKYGVPRNTIWTWVKNKSKYFAALEQSSNKWKKLRSSDYERVGHVC